MPLFELKFPSTGLDCTIDVTDEVSKVLRGSGAKNSMATVFARGSSVGLVCMRYEPGTVRDLLGTLERAAPLDKTYAHELTTEDRNGSAHIRSALLGTSVSVPWGDDAFDVAPSHRIVLFDFDLKPATRTVVVSI